MNFKEKEKLAFELVDKGQKQEATALLSELVVEAADNNDFAKADSLRQTIIELNPMALTQIINLREILEEKKSRAIDPNHKNAWRKLYKEFSTEEATEFYYSLKTINLKPGKFIIQQGKFNDKLFFINRGTLKTICKSKASEVFLKKISPGEACGLSTFFFISTATTSVITSSRVNLSYITQKSLSNIIKNLSGFDSKLLELCKNLVRINSADIIEKQAIERRKYQRFPVEGNITANLIGTDGEPSEQPFFGILDDLSRGGACFRIKSSTKEYARSLLGCKAVIKLTPKGDKNKPIETKKGWIVSLDDHLFNNYSISFRFRTPLSRKLVHKIAKP